MHITSLTVLRTLSYDCLMNAYQRIKVVFSPMTVWIAKWTRILIYKASALLTPGVSAVYCSKFSSNLVLGPLCVFAKIKQSTSLDSNKCKSLQTLPKISRETKLPRWELLLYSKISLWYNILDGISISTCSKKAFPCF